MTNLEKYQTIYVVKTFDDEIFYIPESQIKAFEHSLNTQRFVGLDGGLVNVSTIKSVKKSVAEDIVSKFTPEQRKRFDLRCKEFQSKLNRPPNKTEKNKIAAKIIES